MKSTRKDIDAERYIFVFDKESNLIKRHIGEYLVKHV